LLNKKRKTDICSLSDLPDKQLKLYHKTKPKTLLMSVVLTQESFLCSAEGKIIAWARKNFSLPREFSKYL